MSPQSGISFTSLTGFSFRDGCVMRRQAFGKHSVVFLHLHDHKHFLSGLTGPFSLLNHSQFAYWPSLLEENTRLRWQEQTVFPHSVLPKKMALVGKELNDIKLPFLVFSYVTFYNFDVSLLFCAT